MKDCSDPLSFVDSLLIDPSFLFFSGKILRCNPYKFLSITPIQKRCQALSASNCNSSLFLGDVLASPFIPLALQ
jgi:hypothetical protein